MIGNNSKGLSLIEMVVAIGLFGVAVTIGVGLILSLTKAQAKAINIRAAMDGLGFAMEIMTKEIRTGSSYSLSGPGEFSFTNAVDDDITYRLASTRLERKCTGTCGGGGNTDFLPITSSEVKVQRLGFYLHGEGVLPADTEQPWVTIVMGVRAGAKDAAEVNLQTTVTQRRIDN